MIVTPVSPTGFRNTTSVNFASKRRNDTEGIEYTPTHKRGTTDLAKMPVMVLLAMTPAMANAKTPAIPELETSPLTEVVYEATEPKTETPVYVLKPETQQTKQSEYPYGWKHFKLYDIKYTQPGKCPIYQFDMVFAARNGASQDPKSVTNIFLVPKGEIGGNDLYSHPPDIKELIYHNTGDGKEFYGVRVVESLLDVNGERIGNLSSEVKIDTKSVEAIIDLLNKKSIWKNGTNIKYSETTSPKKLPPEQY